MSTSGAVGNGDHARLLGRRLLAAGLFTAVLAGCSSGSPRTLPTPDLGKSPSPQPASPTASGEQALVLAQYQRFWSSLAPVSRMPASARRAELAKYAVDPELKSLLAGMLKLDSQGRFLYGVNQPRPTASVSTDGLTAVVNDCQDSSRAGAANRATEKPITVGTARNHVVVTMKKPSGVWKVSFVSYSKTSC